MYMYNNRTIAKQNSSWMWKDPLCPFLQQNVHGGLQLTVFVVGSWLTSLTRVMR